VIDSRLREIHQGEWQGLQVADIVERYGNLFLARSENPWSVAPPGGETAFEVRVRMWIALSEIAARHPDGVIAIVSHGFALAVARTILTHAPAGSIWELVPANCTPLIMDWVCSGQNEPK
jgi:broad specificity phosphatase PhoE